MKFLLYFLLLKNCINQLYEKFYIFHYKFLFLQVKGFHICMKMNYLSENHLYIIII